MKKKILVLDFETTYDDDYSLKKLNPFLYVHDPRFEVIGFSMKWYGEGKAKWYTGDKDYLKKELASIDWANTIVCAHNTNFDGLILTQHFGIYPAGWIDTLSMARPQFGVEVGGSLSKLSAHFGIGVKGEEVIHAKGLRRVDFDPAQLARYGQYCCNDVELTEKILGKLSQVVTPLEMRVIDYTIRMTVEPRLILDLPMLQQNLIDIQTKKKEALQFAADAVGVLPEMLAKELGSGPKFAKMLRTFGIEPALKDSPTAKNEDGSPKKTFAFAKTDPFMVELLEHEDDRVQALVSTRMGIKSTIAESRTLRLIEAAKIGAVPFPLKYASAHTNRWGGDFKWNFQNIPKHQDVKSGKREALRDAIMAPPGYILVAADSSQVEARVNAWLACQDDLLELFALGGDPYCEFGSVAYGRQITKADTIERFVGKGCVLGLGFGMGAKKLRASLKKPMGGIFVDLPEERCQELVNIYRMKYTQITQFWQQCRFAVQCLYEKRGFKFGRDNCLSVEDGYIQLPSGTRLYYPDMRREKGEKGWDYSYIDREGKKRKRIYSTLLVENIVQAVARDILAWQMVQIGKKWPVVGMVHDELIAMCPENLVVDCQRDVEATMKLKPEWAALCPVTCEGASAVRYGDC